MPQSTPAQSGGTGTQAFNENTNPTSDSTTTDDAPKMSFMDKFKALSTTKKVLYIAIPVVAIVVIGIVIKKSRQ
jgi:cell division protein FtsL